MVKRTTEAVMFNDAIFDDSCDQRACRMRWKRTSTLAARPDERQKQHQVALQILGDQKVLLDVLVTLLAELRGDLGMRQQKADLVRRALDRMGQQPRLLVDDLRGNAAHGRCDDWF